MTNKFQESLDQAVGEAVNYERQTLEDFLLYRFGTKEVIKDVAKLYVIEEKPIRMEADDQIDEPYVDFRFTHTYRVRLKTPEEFAHDRADEIIEKNTRKLNTCIVCGNPITPEEVEVKTIHGYYHGAPYRCLEGHEDEL